MRTIPTLGPDVLLLSPASSASDQMNLGFLARIGGERWKYSVPINWKADPFNDRNWRFNLSAWRIMDPLLNDYIVENPDPRLLSHAVEIALDWYSFNIVSDNEYTMRWYDMAVGLRALRLSFLLDCIEKSAVSVGERDIESLRHTADEHLSHLLDENEIALNNHGIFQIVGLYVLSDVCCAGNRKQENFDYCVHKLREIFDHNFTEEGVQKECSPDYQKYVAELFNRVIRATPLAEEFRSSTRKALQLIPYMVQPNGFFPALGDTQGDRQVQTLTSVPSGEIRTAGKEKLVVKDLSRSGYVIVRSLPNTSLDNQSMLFFSGMNFSMSHKHADELSITYFANGQDLFIDSGKYAYQYDKKREYVLSAAAHNSVSLLNTPISPKNIAGPRGSFLSRATTVDDFILLRGKVCRPNLYVHERRIRIFSRTRIRIYDQVGNHSDDTVVSSLHLAPGLVPDLFDNGFRVSLRDGSIVTVSVEGAEGIDEHFGQEEPMLGWYSPSYFSLEPAYVVRSFAKPGKDALLIWDIRIRNQMPRNT